MILIDSPYANIANIARALRACGATLEVSRDPARIAAADKLVLPGVGSFAAAMSWLEETNIDAAIRDAVERGAFLLGICVGHQLLFDASTECGVTVCHPERERGTRAGGATGTSIAPHTPRSLATLGMTERTRGLGLIDGNIERLDGALPVPQIGWNRVAGEGALFDGIARDTAFYFVHSYAARATNAQSATADYNGRFTAAVQRDRIAGVQFHPEKSSRAGLRVLRNFVQWN